MSIYSCWYFLLPYSSIALRFCMDSHGSSQVPRSCAICSSGFARSCWTGTSFSGPFLRRPHQSHQRLRILTVLLLCRICSRTLSPGVKIHEHSDFRRHVWVETDETALCWTLCWKHVLKRETTWKYMSTSWSIMTLSGGVLPVGLAVALLVRRLSFRPAHDLRGLLGPHLGEPPEGRLPPAAAQERQGRGLGTKERLTDRFHGLPRLWLPLHPCHAPWAMKGFLTGSTAWKRWEKYDEV